MQTNVPDYITAWKLFDICQVNGEIVPRALVYGRPVDGKRTKVFTLDEELFPEEETPGFTCFPNYAHLKSYLPRFKVRGRDLYMCRIMVSGYNLSRNPNYVFAKSIIILSRYWCHRVPGSNVI